MSRLFVHATNVHSGGGAILLYDLLRSIPTSIETVAYLDARMIIPDDLSDSISICFFRPDIISRVSAEFRIARKAKPDDIILCFGNLPPLIKAHGNISVFLQNRYLVDPSAPMKSMPGAVRVRIWLERFWLYRYRSHAQKYFVQTSTMQRLASEHLGVNVACTPFIPASLRRISAVKNSNLQCFDYIYVASGEGHKNHRTLITAWELLADEGLFPSLALTLSPQLETELCDYINKKKESKSLRIINLGNLGYNEILDAYHKSSALIYPSTFESFGLPLIEAKNAGLAIIAPELDYVRDIVDPDETFNPNSPVSITRAVKRNLRIQNNAMHPSGVESLLEKVFTSYSEK